MAELFEADLVDRFAGRQEPFVSRHIARREPCHFGAHGLRITAVVEAFAAVEPDAVIRRHRPQIDVVGHAPAAQGPQLLEQERRGDDGRAGIEGESVLPVHVGTPPRRVEFLEDGHPIAPCAQPDGCCQTAKAAADHDRMGLARCRRRPD